ncbi:2OG-Fe(II) oxygenase [Leptolyngbya ohadii]|uniref:2OG-Fe(II) oxygenase n=1 Tax=Leptolyngbya ohadii TaxID=1962290 RepID=UPI000B59DFCF|nr:2OG-Fe(II) oxygenase [Leptolyngbya ohadii]
MTFLSKGDPVPWFTAASSSNPAYHFESVGGYRIILSFLGHCSTQSCAKVLQDFAALQPQLEQYEIPFFGVTIDPQDIILEQLIRIPTYFKLIWDFDSFVSSRYGVLSDKSKPDFYRPTTLVLDENLHVLKVFPLENPESHAAEVFRFITSLPAPEPEMMAVRQAPVLLIPHVLDPEFCEFLIYLYQTNGGQDSGFMRQIDGKTVEILDANFKQRKDFHLTDTAHLQAINDLILRRVKPEIEKAFQFSITRFERYLVACYEAENQGFFNRHRDNTTKGTAHRRFAMTINLNTGNYTGGCLRFPEYGNRLYRPQTGEAVIFSCSLLHEVTPVLSGERFALLSFFYSDEDAKVRDRNRKHVVLNSYSRPGSPGEQQFAVKSLGFQAGSQSKPGKKRRK